MEGQYPNLELFQSREGPVWGPEKHPVHFTLKIFGLAEALIAILTTTNNRADNIWPMRRRDYNTMFRSLLSPATFCPSVLRHSGCVTHTPTHLTIKHTSKYHVHSVLHTPTYQIGGHRLLFYVVVFLMTDAFWWRTSVMKILKLWFDQRMLMLYDLLHLLTHCPHKPNTHVS